MHIDITSKTQMFIYLHPHKDTAHYTHLSIMQQHTPNESGVERSNCRGVKQRSYSAVRSGRQYTKLMSAESA